MDSIDTLQPGSQLSQEKDINNFDIDEEDAIRKVEANMHSQPAQEGVREVEAVTLSWTKTSLACAFLWYFQTLTSLRPNPLLMIPTACGSSILQTPSNPP
jgi:hypothetical protein